MAQVVRELELLHATYLNSSYQGHSTVGARRSTRGQRLRQVDAGSVTAWWRTACVSQAVDPGSMLRVELEVHNVGFAPQMPKEVVLVLSRGDRTHRVVITDPDPRRWAPEAGTVTLRGSLPLPADARDGRWRLALHVADPSPSLRGDSRYAIRLANEGISFDESSGGNILAEDVEVR